MAVTARFTADFTSFIGAIDKAEVELKSLEDSAFNVQSKLNQMVDKFSGRKLIQEAQLMAAAVEKAGGVSTLTAKELEQVGAKAADAAEKMKKLGVEVPPGVQKLADAFHESAKASDTAGISFTKLVSSLVTSQAIIAGVKAAWHAVTGEISSSITAANEAEKAHVQLVAALRAQGTAIPSVITAFSGYADALQKTTIYQDDAIEGAEALLVQVGNVMPRDMEKALQAVTNLASGLGIDLTTATLQVAKAAEGNTGALKKAGVAIDEAKVASQGFGYVLDEVNKKFGGQAEAIAGTYQGRLQQLGNTWNNVEESIGRVITQNATVLGVFEQLNQALAQNTGELNTNLAVNELVSGAVIAGVKAFSLSLSAIDLTQQAYATLRVASNEVAKAFVNIGIAVLDSAHAIGTATKYINPVSWSQTWKQGMREVADASTFLKGAVEGLNQDSVIAVSRADRWSTSITALNAGADKLAGQLESTRGKTKALADATQNATGVWDRQTTAVGKSADATKKAAVAIGDFVGPMQLLGKELPRLVVWIDDLSDRSGQFRDELENLTSSVNEFHGGITIAGDEMATVTIPMFSQLPDVVAQGTKALHDAASVATTFGSSMKDALLGIPDMLQQAFIGGGGLSGGLKAVAVKLGADFGKDLKAGIQDQTGSGFNAVTGKAAAATGAIAGLGAAISGASGKAAVASAALAGVGVAATAIGAGATIAGAAALGAATAGIGIAAVGAYYGIKKLLNDTEKKINPVREQFVQLNGGLAELNKRAHDAGMSLDALLSAKNADQLQKAVDDLNASFDLQASAMDLLVQTAQKYGFTLEELGPALQRQELGKQAEEIYKDFQVLTAGGLDHVAVLTKMSEGVNEYVQNAAAMGIEVPASMEPMLQQMIDMGLLTDASGNKIEDLAGLGVTFSTTLTAGFKSVVDAVEKLTAAISGKLGTAIADVPKDIDIGVHFNVDDLPDLSGGFEPIRMARGGRGVVNKPTVFVAGEQGSEAFAFGSAAEGGGDNAGILQQILEALERQPRAFRDAAMGAAV